MRRPVALLLAVLAGLGLASSCTLVAGLDLSFGGSGGSFSSSGSTSSGSTGSTSSGSSSGGGCSENECIAYACGDGGLTGSTIAVDATCSRPPPEPPPAMGACEPNAYNVAVCAQCSTTPGGCTGATPKCLDNMCVAGNCGDGTVNGTETDKDCGGSACVPCAAGKTCTAGTDCSSKICMGSPKVCQAVSCSDGTQNGAETDVDCGGTTCPACVSGRMCALPSDCVSGVCTPADGGSNVCQAATCTDGVQNGTETGIDCGGTCTPCGDAG